MDQLLAAQLQQQERLAAMEQEMHRLPAIQESGEASAAILRDIPPLLGELAKSTFNPYTQSVISVEHDEQFRADVIAHYYPRNMLALPQAGASVAAGSATPQRLVKKQKHNEVRVACMVTGVLGSGQQVIAAHILPHSSKIGTLHHAGVSQAEVSSVRNGLLLADAIEKVHSSRPERCGARVAWPTSTAVSCATADADLCVCLAAACVHGEAFDRLDVSFVPLSPLAPHRFVMKIWTPPGCPASGTPGKQGYHEGDVRPLPLWSNGNDVSVHTIGEQQWAGAELIHGAAAGSGPMRRALSYQAWLAYDRALKNGWVEDAGAETPPEFGTPQSPPSPFQRQRSLIEE